MSGVSFGGLATGMDTGAIISQLVALKRIPIDRLEQRKTGYQNQISALGTLKSKLMALQDAAKELDTANEFSSLKATTTDEDFLKVSAGSNAAPGSYAITVHSRAVAQKNMSQGLDSRLDSVGSGTLSFTVDGETTDLTLTGFNSLESLANLINDNVEGVGASILFDGSATGGYRLVLSGDAAGSEGAFTVDTSGLSGGVALDLSNETPAQDAHLTIDGVEVYAGSNSAEGVISGLTLDLMDADPGRTMYVEVGRDIEGIGEKVSALVDAYNDIFSFVKEQSGSEGDLYGSPTLRSVASQVERVFTSAFTEGQGSLQTFSMVGITRGDARQLTFNEDDFAEALTDQYGNVRDLFIQREGNDGKMVQIDDLIESLTDSVDGMFKSSTDILNTKIDNADNTIARYERSVESYQLTLERKFSAMELMVSQLQNQGNSLMSIGY